MKILIDASRNEIPNPTGTSVYSKDVLSRIVPLLVKSNEVTLAARQPLQETFSSIAKQRIFGPPILWSLIGMSLEQLRGKYESVFIPSHVLPLMHAPATVVIHDVAFIRFPKAYSWKSRLYLKWSTRRIVKRAKRIICVSQATRDDVAELFRADPSKLEVIYPGFTVPPEATIDSTDQAEFLRQLRLIKGEYLISIGRVEEKKNIERLLVAYNATVKSQNLGHRLVLVGAGGVGRERIDATIKRLGIEDRVVFTDHIANTQKWQLLDGAAALTYPSLYEGFGYPILEAFAARTPVLTANISSMPEVAGDAAVYVDPTDPESIGQGLEKILTDTALRSDLILKGAKRLQSFRWSKQAALITQAIEGVGK